MSDHPDMFLGVAPPTDPPPRVGVLPVPFEQTVSYEGGAAQGPAAIIAASQQVELYDRRFGCDPCDRYGITTAPPLALPACTTPEAVEKHRAAAATMVAPGRLLVGLGGEHAVTVGLLRGTRDALGKPLTLVQIDAHADLRDEYDGDPYSHACVAQRLLDDGAARVVQVGVRSLCREEARFIDRSPSVETIFAEQIADDRDWLERLRAAVSGHDVYLSIDVDGLDPSIIPATGTPEPGGLSWRQALAAIDTVSDHATVIGLDCVELAPRPGLHAADFAAAKLVYLAINRVAASRGWLDG